MNYIGVVADGDRDQGKTALGHRAQPTVNRHQVPCVRADDAAQRQRTAMPRPATISPKPTAKFQALSDFITGRLVPAT